MIRRRLTFVAIAAVFSFSGCHCSEPGESGWDLEEAWQLEEDASVDAGAEVGDARDAPADVEPDVDSDVEDAPDVEEEPDTEPVEPWQPEEVEPSVSRSHALTDRTSLAVDPDGTLWLGYHACGDLDCAAPVLEVAGKPVDGDWSGESIREHEGIFGVSVIEAGEPIVVFPDSHDRTYKAAMRQPGGQWSMYTFPAERSYQPRYDGFDVTNDGTSYFVSFAPQNAEEVEFYAYDTSAASPAWRPKASLTVGDPQAAMERGLRADRGESVYLVNQSGGSGVYGVYRYDEGDDAWPQSVELDRFTDTFVHSLYITSDFRLCMSGSYEGSLLVTCGSMYDLTLDHKHFAREELAQSHPSSIIEGDDGTLYVAYNPAGNEELRVARRRPESGTWIVETVFDGPSYGVSTAIDHSGDLVISFYTCDEVDRCSLQVLWETPE